MAEYDLKKAKKAKGTLSKENKSLKEASHQLKVTAQEQHEKVNKGKDLNNPTILELKEENEGLRKQLEEKDAKAQEPKTEQGIIDGFNSLPDLQTMTRVMSMLQMSFTQKYYNSMMPQQNSQAENPSAKNGSMPTGDQMMTGNFMMGGQMMSPMGYNMGGVYPEAAQTKTNKPSQQ